MSGPPAELALTAADGTRLVGTEWFPAAAPSSVLVVVHGLKDHVGRYGELATRAGRDGRSVIGFDLRGHGRSGGARAWVRRFDEYLADLDLVLGEVERRHPGLPVHLFGHSMGGAIVTKYVLDRRPKVAGVILSAPALRPPASVSAVTAGFTGFLGAVAPHAAVFRLPNRDFSRDPAVVQAMENDPLISQMPAPARTAAELLRSMRWIRERAAEFTVPLLALHGTADRLTHPEGSRAFVAAVRSPSKELRMYPSLVHDLLHEPERATVLEDISAWITTQSR